MSTTEKPELLPCPWCSGDDLRERSCADDGQMSDYAFIRCCDCQAQGPVRGQIGGRGWKNPYDAWNARPSQPASDTPDPRDEVIAEMREALTELVAAMRRYQQDVDDLPPLRHVAMMARARAALSKGEGAK